MPEPATEYYKKVASHLFSSLGWPCGYRIVFLGYFFWGAAVFWAILGNFGQFWAFFWGRPISLSLNTGFGSGYVLVSLRAYAAHRSRGGVLPFEDRNCRPISFGAKSFDRRFTKL